MLALAGSDDISIDPRSVEMIATTYELPFPFEAPAKSPWDGQRSVELIVDITRAHQPDETRRLQSLVASFGQLASVGGLAGTAVEPWLSTCTGSSFTSEGQSWRVRFEGCKLDERSTHCLLCLVLATHAQLPIARARLWADGIRLGPLAFDPHLENPYPALFTNLPFPNAVEDSESETRVLRVQFVDPLADEAFRAVEARLLSWAGATTSGAFGVAPVPPESCNCIPEPIEHDDHELEWALEKCRFHHAAIDSLIAVCAGIHHHTARVANLVVE